MKRGQQKLGLIFLAITAIVATVGLVITLSNGTTGQAVNVYPGQELIRPSGVGNVYGGTQQGIARTYEQPNYYYGMNAQQVQYPGFPTALERSTIGDRAPVFIEEGFRGIEDSACISDLVNSRVLLGASPENALSSYAVPSKGRSAAGEAEGWYPSSSSARAQPPQGQFGRGGGRVLWYARSPMDANLVRQRIKQVLVDNAGGRKQMDWDTVPYEGIAQMPRCRASEEDFIFPQ